MRKLYALLAGIGCTLAAITAHAQTPSNVVANFTFTVNASGNAVFTNTSLVDTTNGHWKAQWTFGDGSSQLTNVLAGTQHQYQASGTYTVCLKILLYVTNTSEPTVVAQVCKTVVIESVCRADFERGPTTSSNPLTTSFFAIPWHSNQNRPVYICWNFGDGQDTCIQYSNTYPGPYNVSHTYNHGGNYQVCVKIVYQGGCESTKCKVVEVVSPDSCRADFERLPQTTASNINVVTFKALPWHNNNKKPSKICWTFGDGRDTCINYGQDYTGLYQVNHVYPNHGQYNVCVKINYYGGCEASKCKEIQVSQDSCRADFERINLTTTNSLLHATFKALPWHNNNKKPSRICWNFGDGQDTCINYGQDYTGQYNVNHLYSALGEYNVCVKITYYGGCEASKCRVINLNHPDSCRADFERLPYSTANNPLTTTFKAIPWHSNGNKPRQVCWTFGDGRDTCINYLAIYNGNYSVTHTYNQPGNYNVCVKISYYGGCESSKCRSVQIFSPDSCRADFERLPNTTSNNSLGVTFKALPWHYNNKKPSRVCWNFGDGRDTCINYGGDYTGLYTVNHTYNQPGNYNVCVKITYYGGCEASKCKIIELSRPDSCRADFERIPLTTTNNILTTGFRAITWHNNNKKPSKICWTFGDGRDTCINYGPDYNGQYVVSHTYAQPGEYQVCVKIIYYGGCDAHKCERINVPHQNCNVHLFQLASSANSLQRGFYAAASSTPPKRVERICWNFGDGQDTCINATATDSVSRYISHIYPGPGEYRACVKVYFEGGCIAYDCEEIVIRSNTDLCGGYMTDSLVGPRTFKFKGYSIHRPNDEVLSYRWTFGDGTSALGQEVTHMYNVAGEYRVCLTILTRSGCETRICNTVRIPGNNTPRLVITPNPVINILHALFYSTHTETVTIKVINSMGVVVRSITRNAVVGANNWDFDATNLLPGYYSFVVQSPNQFASALFLKQ